MDLVYHHYAKDIYLKDTANPQIYLGMDPEAMASFFVKKNLQLLRTQPLKQIQDGINKQLTDLFANYRSTCVKKDAPSGQLVLPENLKQLPCLIFSSLKLPAFRLSNVSFDERIYDLTSLASMPIANLMGRLYPKIYSVHDIYDKEIELKSGNALAGDAIEDRVLLPDTIGCYLSRTRAEGCYLVDTGDLYLVFARREADLETLESVL